MANSVRDFKICDKRCYLILIFCFFSVLCCVTVLFFVNCLFISTFCVYNLYTLSVKFSDTNHKITKYFLKKSVYLCSFTTHLYTFLKISLWSLFTVTLSLIPTESVWLDKLDSFFFFFLAFFSHLNFYQTFCNRFDLIFLLLYRSLVLLFCSFVFDLVS